MTAPLRVFLVRCGYAFAIVWRAARWPLLGILGTVLIGGAIPAVAAWTQRVIIDGLVRHTVTGHALLWWSLAFGLAGVLAVLLQAVRQPLEGLLRRRVEALGQDRLFEAVSASVGIRRFEDPAYLDRVRMAQQAGRIGPGNLVTAALSGGQSLVSAAGFVLTLGVVSPALVAIVCLSAVPSVVAQLRLTKRRNQTDLRNSPLLRRQMFHTQLLTQPEAAKEIRLFRLGDYLRARMRTDLAEIQAADQKQDFRVMRSQGVLNVLTAVITAGSLVWVVRLASDGHLSVGDIALFLAALTGLQSALSGIASRVGDVYQASVSLGYFLDIVRQEPDLPIGRPGATARETASGPPSGIEFRDVWFRYDSAAPWVFRGLDLRIQAGHSTALVGLNGSGKSTLVKLLCRFYDPESGVILWDGVDIRDIPATELRDRIGAVFQDHMNYDFTAAENIGIGDVDRLGDRAAIERSAERAGVASMIEALPRRYDSMLSRVFAGGASERGVNLSGGQWQRVALARCLMRADRDLLILDEPSSGLDAEAEHEVHAMLTAMRVNRTSLLISHRLSAIREADRILVLADGRLVEEGTHGELMTGTTEYRRLFELQASGYRDDADALPADGRRLPAGRRRVLTGPVPGDGKL